MNNFCERLREERERLGYNQADFGEIGGVKKLAQFNYEKGERSPDAAYLGKIASIGVDIIYLLTGQRNTPISVPINPREEALLDNYRHSDAQGRKAVETTASAFAQQKTGQRTANGG